MPRHLHALNGLPFHERHRDPFDHLIAAQAMVEAMTLVTKDQNTPFHRVPIIAP